MEEEVICVALGNSNHCPCWIMKCSRCFYEKQSFWTTICLERNTKRKNKIKTQTTQVVHSSSFCGPFCRKVNQRSGCFVDVVVVVVKQKLKTVFLFLLGLQPQSASRSQLASSSTEMTDHIYCIMNIN